jgi:hypothetical protein
MDSEAEFGGWNQIHIHDLQSPSSSSYEIKPIYQSHSFLQLKNKTSNTIDSNHTHSVLSRVTWKSHIRLKTEKATGKNMY